KSRRSRMPTALSPHVNGHDLAKCSTYTVTARTTTAATSRTTLPSPSQKQAVHPTAATCSSTELKRTVPTYRCFLAFELFGAKNERLNKPGASLTLKAPKGPLRGKSLPAEKEGIED